MIERPARLLVEGRVLLWGAVEEREHGYRASEAEIEELIIQRPPPRCPNGHPTRAVVNDNTFLGIVCFETPLILPATYSFDYDGLCRELEETYGVPTRMMDGPTIVPVSWVSNACPPLS